MEELITDKQILPLTGSGLTLRSQLLEALLALTTLRETRAWATNSRYSSPQLSSGVG